MRLEVPVRKTGIVAPNRGGGESAAMSVLVQMMHSRKILYHRGYIYFQVLSSTRMIFDYR